MANRDGEGGDGRGDSRSRVQIGHKEARLMISRAWDGELSESEEEILFEHLYRCEECLTAAERMRTLIEALEAALKARFE